MSALAASHDALLPQQDSRLGLGAALALLAHGGLVAALALGLSWRLPTADAVVSAELWAAVPQVAAPMPVAPPPPPPAPPPAPAPAPAPAPPPPTAAERQAVRDAEIATEKAKAEQQRRRDEQAAERARLKEADEAKRLKQRLEARRLAEEQEARRLKDAQKEKADQAKAEQARALTKQKDLAAQKEREKAADTEAKAKADAKAQAEQIAKQREENLKRMLGQAGATGAATATGTAKADAAPSAGYAGRIKGAILPNIVQPEKERGNPVTEVEVRCAPDGSIVGRRISKASGNPAWDETVLRAIDKTRQLPLDNGRIPPTITMVFSQNEAR